MRRAARAEEPPRGERAPNTRPGSISSGMSPCPPAAEPATTSPRWIGTRSIQRLGRSERRGGGQGRRGATRWGWPPPQGDVPDAPGTQIAAAENEEGQVTRVTRVANAVPGKPDGE